MTCKHIPDEDDFVPVVEMPPIFEMYDPEKRREHNRQARAYGILSFIGAFVAQFFLYLMICIDSDCPSLLTTLGVAAFVGFGIWACNHETDKSVADDRRQEIFRS